MVALLHVDHRTTIGLTDWQLDPPVIIGLIGMSALYLWATSDSERRHYPNAAPVSAWQMTSFFLGLLAFAVALLTPLEPLSDSFLFSAHMVQHILITVVGPPLMLLGVPRWLYEAIARGAGRVWRGWMFLTGPLVGFVLFHGIFTFVHFPEFYNAALRDENIHILEHVMMWSAAFVGWWCVLAPTRELGALSQPLKGLYLLAGTVPGQVVGAIITFSDSVIYDEYLHASRVWGISPIADQQIGGLLMWVGVGTFFLIAALIVFFRWGIEQTSADRKRLDAARTKKQLAS